MKRISWAIVVAVALGALWIWAPWRRLPILSSAQLPVSAPSRRSDGRASVQDRLNECGQAARARLAPFFGAAAVPYPPGSLVLLGLKDSKTLQVCASGPQGPLRLIRSYPILAASGQSGPKLREGDRQVPEGIYRIESLNPNSRYHLSLRIGYPNEFDRAMARLDGRRALGGDIMIHGSDASVGCLAMGDEAAEDLFVLAADTGVDRIKVVLAPGDLRKSAAPAGPHLPSWAGRLYEHIRAELDRLP
jgi:hypothetical protein